MRCFKLKKTKKMKKNLLIVALAIFSLATVSCGKKADSVETEAKNKVETTTPETSKTPEVAETSEESDALTQYEAFVDKYIALLKKVKGGDMAAAQEMTKMGQEATEFQQKFAAESATWTQAQQDKLATITKKLVDAASN